MVLGGMDLGRCLSHEGETLMNGIGAFTERGSKEMSSPLYNVRIQGEVCVCEESPQRTRLAHWGQPLQF